MYSKQCNTDIMVKTYNCSSVTGTCIFGDAATFIKDCRVLFGDIFIVPFLGSALGLTAMCSLGWRNLVAFDWNDLPVGREFDCKFLKNVKCPPHALPLPPPSPRLTLIGALCTLFKFEFLCWRYQTHKNNRMQA